MGKNGLGWADDGSGGRKYVETLLADETEQRRGRTTLGEAGLAKVPIGGMRFSPLRWGYRRVDIPFELVGEVAGASAVAEARHVQRGSAARHVGLRLLVCWKVKKKDQKGARSRGEISPCLPR